MSEPKRTGVLEPDDGDKGKAEKTKPTPEQCDVLFGFILRNKGLKPGTRKNLETIRTQLGEAETAAGVADFFEDFFENEGMIATLVGGIRVYGVARRREKRKKRKA